MLDEERAKVEEAAHETLQQKIERYPTIVQSKTTKTFVISQKEHWSDKQTKKRVSLLKTKPWIQWVMEG